MQCLQPIETSSNETHLGIGSSSRVYHSSCNLFFCVECAGLLHYKAPEPCGCKGKSPSCSLRPLVRSLPSPSPADSPLPLAEMSEAFTISSKIQALIMQMKGQIHEKQ
jgi:hypothetical protein